MTTYSTGLNTDGQPFTEFEFTGTSNEFAQIEQNFIQEVHSGAVYAPKIYGGSLNALEIGSTGKLLVSLQDLNAFEFEKDGSNSGQVNLTMNDTNQYSLNIQTKDIDKTLTLNDTTMLTSTDNYQDVTANATNTKNGHRYKTAVTVEKTVARVGDTYRSFGNGSPLPGDRTYLVTVELVVDGYFTNQNKFFVQVDDVDPEIAEPSQQQKTILAWKHRDAGTTYTYTFIQDPTCQNFPLRFGETFEGNLYNGVNSEEIDYETSPDNITYTPVADFDAYETAMAVGGVYGKIIIPIKGQGSSSEVLYYFDGNTTSVTTLMGGVMLLRKEEQTQSQIQVETDQHVIVPRTRDYADLNYVASMYVTNGEYQDFRVNQSSNSYIQLWNRSGEEDTSVQLISDIGGIQLSSSNTDRLTLTSNDGTWALYDTSTGLVEKNKIYMTGNGAVGDYVQVQALTGTDSNALRMSADAGGITASASDIIKFETSNNQLTTLASNAILSQLNWSDASNTITFQTLGTDATNNISDTILLKNTHGTGADAIKLETVNDGGIALHSGTESLVDITSNDITLEINRADDSNTINIQTTGTNATSNINDIITVTNTMGTGAEAIKLYTSNDGGIAMHSGTESKIDVTSNDITLEINRADDSNTINIQTTGTNATSNINDTITVTNTMGTGAEAIKIYTSNDGGVAVHSGTESKIDVTSNDITLEINRADDSNTINIQTTGTNATSNINDTITMTNTMGTGAEAIKLYTSNDGGVAVHSGTESKIDVTSNDITLEINRTDDSNTINIQTTGTNATSNINDKILVTNTFGNAADAIKVYASNDGGIQLHSGSNSRAELTNANITLEVDEPVASTIHVKTTGIAAGNSNDKILVQNVTGTTTDAIKIAANNDGGVQLASGANHNIQMTKADFLMTLDETSEANSIILQTTATNANNLGDQIHLINTHSTAADAVKVHALNDGGIQIYSGANSKLDVTKMDISMTLNEADAANTINMQTTGTNANNTGDKILVKNTHGTNADAVKVEATNDGGVQIRSGANSKVDLGVASINMEVDEPVASSISVHTTGTNSNNTSDTILVKNTQGTGVDAIKIVSTNDGGVQVHSGANNQFNMTVADATLVLNEADAINTINLQTTGTSASNLNDQIIVTNTHSTNAEAIKLIAVNDGGVAVHSGTESLLDITSNDITLEVNRADDSNNSINILTTGAHVTSNIGDTILVSNTGGTGANAVKIIAVNDGGVQVHSGANNQFNMTVADATLVLNEADAINTINLQTTGTSTSNLNDQIIVTNTHSTNAEAIKLVAVNDGGVAVHSGTESLLDVTSNDITLEVNRADDSNNSINILTTGAHVTSNIGDTILVSNTGGTGADAVKIVAVNDGGVQVHSGANNQFNMTVASATLVLNEADAINTINLQTTGTSTSNLNDQIVVTNTHSTNAEAIKLIAVNDGGIAVHSGTESLLDVTSNDITLEVNRADNSNNSINILTTGAHATSNISDTILVSNAGGTGVDAVKIVAVNDGGVQVHSGANNQLNLTSNTGVWQLNEADIANTIDIKTTATTATNIGDKILISNKQGTGADAVKIHSSNDGGVQVHSGANSQLNMTSANVSILVDEPAASTINIKTTGVAGANSNDVITIENTTGNADGSVKLSSTAGGVDIVNTGTGVAKNMRFTSTGHIGDKMLMKNYTGTASNSIEIYSSNGGIIIDSSNSGTIINGITTFNSNVTYNAPITTTGNGDVTIHSNDTLNVTQIETSDPSGTKAITITADIINFEAYTSNTDAVLNIAGSINTVNTTYTDLYVQDKTIMLGITDEETPVADGVTNTDAGLNIWGTQRDTVINGGSSEDVMAKSFKWNNGSNGISSIDDSNNSYANTDADDAYYNEANWELKGGAFRLSRFITDSQGNQSKITYSWRINSAGELEIVKLMADVEDLNALVTKRRVTRFGIESTRNTNHLNDVYGTNGDLTNTVITFEVTVDGVTEATAQSDLANIKTQLQSIVGTDAVVTEVVVSAA
jgi:hypothetical protein